MKIKSRRFSKKALEKKYVVLMIIALITIALIVLLFINLKNSQRFDRDACHEAVVYRGTINEALDNDLEIGKIIVDRAVQAIRLSCKTDEITISTTDKEEIKKQIADEMTSCWAMLGEGKVNFFGRGWSDENRCVFCSKIKFSDKVKKNVDEINDLSTFMLETRMPGKDITYTDFLAGSEEHIPYKKVEGFDVAAPKEKTLSLDDLETSEEPDIDVSPISPGGGKDYVVVYRLWQTDKLLAVAGGIAAAGTTYAAKLLGKQAIKNAFKKLEIRDDNGKWQRVLYKKIPDGSVKPFVPDGKEILRFGQIWRAGEEVPLFGYKVIGEDIMKYIEPSTNSVTPWKVKADYMLIVDGKPYKGGNYFSNAVVESLKKKTAWVVPDSSMNGASYKYGTGQIGLYGNIKINSGVQIGQVLKGGQPVPKNMEVTKVRLGKPRIVFTFGGSVKVGILTSVVDVAGNILTFASYIYASRTMDSFIDQKYIGYVDIVEYSSEDITDLGCTDLDVVP